MKNLLLTVLLSVTTLFSGMVSGAQFTGTVSTLLREAIQISEQQIVNFNLIPNDDGVCSMNKSGKLSGQCAGLPNGQIGEIALSGTPRQWIDVSVTPGATVDGVTFSPLLNNGATTDAVKLNNQGVATFDVSGDLTLVNAIGGQKNLTYTITLFYQ